MKCAADKLFRVYFPFLHALFYYRMGAGNLSYKELSQLIERRTGGLSVGTHVCSHHTAANKYEQVSNLIE